MNTSEKINMLKSKLTVIEDLVKYIEDSCKSMLNDYRPIDKMEQSWHYGIKEDGRRDYSNKVMEFNEDGSPKMQQVWDNVEITIDELSEEKKATYNAYDEIKNMLFDMVMKGGK